MGIPIAQGGRLPRDRLGASCGRRQRNRGATPLERGTPRPSLHLGHTPRPGRRTRRRRSRRRRQGRARLRPGGAVRPTVYVAHAQFPMDFVTVAVKTREHPSAVIEPSRSASRRARRRFADVSRPQHGAIRRQRRGPAAAVPHLHWGVCGGGSPARRDRHLRRADARRGAADARDRHPPRAWGTAVRGDRPGRPAGGTPRRVTWSRHSPSPASPPASSEIYSSASSRSTGSPTRAS